MADAATAPVANIDDPSGAADGTAAPAASAAPTTSTSSSQDFVPATTDASAAPATPATTGSTTDASGNVATPTSASSDFLPPTTPAANDASATTTPATPATAPATPATPPAAPATPQTDPGNLGTDLGTWTPGQTYTGTGTTSGDSLATDQTFTPSVPAGTPVPTEWNVTPDQTVQGQMDQLTQNMSSNPVYQSLAASINRAQASHGGENSLMGETAAYNGVVNMAFNIASADAATYAKSAEFNASTANQFSLATQNFMYQATLSTQNYQQSQVLQQQQIQGNLQSVSMQVAGQISATTISANATVRAAGTMANAQITAAGIQAKSTLDAIQANFTNQTALNTQMQGFNLQTIGVNEQNQQANIAEQGQWNSSLQYNAGVSAQLQQTLAASGQIGATPGLTGEQQANATATIVSEGKSNIDVLSSLYSPYMPTVPGSGSAGGGSDPYSSYGDYMNFPPAPPPAGATNTQTPPQFLPPTNNRGTGP